VNLATATGVIARLTRTRTWRGRTVWVSGLLMLAAPLFGLLGQDEGHAWEKVVHVTLRLPILLAVAVHLSAGVGEEIEDRTYTYLWSRPIPRAALVLGKLLAVVPMLTVGFMVSVALAWGLLQGVEEPPDLELLVRAELAVFGVVLASGALAIGAGALFPKRPLAFVLIYIMMGEQVLPFVPMLNQLSIAFHGFGLAGAYPPVIQANTVIGSIIGLGVLTSIWLGVALWRVSSAEYSSADG
jgi:ABC-type transport system involved in multi-copper enzyme maturation permease subunit